MKQLRKIILIALVMAAAVSLTACGSPYTTHFSATVMVKTNDSDSAGMSFSTFKGTMVFDVKAEDSDSGIHYTGKLETGSITVYYDNAGTKEEWFTLQAGETVEGTLDNPGEGKVYIIVESDGKCEEGRLSFEVK